MKGRIIWVSARSRDGWTIKQNHESPAILRNRRFQTPATFLGHWPKSSESDALDASIGTF